MTMRMLRTLGALGLAGTMALGACDDEGDKGPAVADLEIVGSWTSPYGTETITNTVWGSDGFTVNIVSYDNTANVAITQSPADAEFGANTFNKQLWTEPAGGVFYYCVASFGLTTEAEAIAAPTSAADPSDLEGVGCGGFPWTKLTAK